MKQFFVQIAGIFLALASRASGQVTQRVNVGSDAAQANEQSYLHSISADGRYVAFASLASNLAPGDVGPRWDIFVRDRQTGLTERISVAMGGGQALHHSNEPAISTDGRYVAFTSLAANLVSGDTNFRWDIFVRDRQTGTNERVSVDTGGAQADENSEDAQISADGRYVVFASTATNLVAGEANGETDVFVRDRQSGTTERVSLTSGGGQASDGSFYPSMSADGRYVAFASFATDLVAGDTNAANDIFVRDRLSGTTERVSLASDGGQADDGSYTPSISADGRYVVFRSEADDLVPVDLGVWTDVFIRDRQNATTELVSVDSNEVQASNSSALASISADGRFVAFQSFASNLAPGANGAGHVFVRDRQLGTTEAASVDSAGEYGNAGSSPSPPSISGDGRYVAFWSSATNLVPADTNDMPDVFVRDRTGGPSFTSLCVPGAGGVIACPCANPSGGFGQGCDNSSATGGALLTASGGSYLSSDSLVFTTLGEKPTALSIVLQGNALIPGGVVYGQGVRCAGGALKRLYTKSASGGIITAPDFGAGDPSVSVRSAALGSTISAGQSRWYLVYYRDPIVLGGCPSVATFNATQTGEVTWSP